MSGIDSTASKISTLCAAIFMRNNLPSGHAVYRKMSDSWFDFFDGDPVMLPLPDGAPRELPLLILRSKSQNWNCTFTSERIAFQWSMTEAQEEIDVNVFLGKAVDFFNEIQSSLNTQVCRLAAMSHRHIICENPGILLATHFCKDEWLNAPLNRPENFELHAHKKYTLYEELEVNSWVRAKSAILLPLKNQAIMVEQDINTLSELTENLFSADEVADFFRFAYPELKKVFGLYFPVGETA